MLAYVVTDFVVPQSPAYLAKARAELFGGLPLWSAATWLPRPQTTLQLIVAIAPAALLAPTAYLAGLWWARRPLPRAAAWVIAAFAVGFYAAYVLSLPTFSYDTYAYVLQSRVFTLHGANPYLTPPAAFADDPDLRFADPDQMKLIVPYGPVWTYAAILCSYVAGGDIVRQLLGFRLMLLGFGLANLALLWALLGRLRPHQRLAGLVFYAWSPIVALKGQEHSDTLTVFLLLLSLWLLTAGRDLPAVAVLTLSVLCKFITGPLLLVELLALWRRRSAYAALAAAGLAALIAVLAFLPVWTGPDLLLKLARDPTAAGRYDSLFTAGRLLATPGLLVLVAWAGLRRGGAVEDRPIGWTAVLLWFALFLMPSAYVSYLMPLVATAALVDVAPIAFAVLALCGVTLLHELAYFARPALRFPERLFEVSRVAAPAALLLVGPTMLERALSPSSRSSRSRARSSAGRRGTPRSSAGSRAARPPSGGSTAPGTRP